jgi:alpha-N-arabinofuranosidase
MKLRQNLINKGVKIFAGVVLAGGALAGGLGGGTALAYDAVVRVDFARPIGTINPDIYGQYIEHVELEDECVYPALWDDHSPFARADGLRRDTLDAVRELGVPVIRWPGGTFADIYRWEDAVGPRYHRRWRSNKAWRTGEPNQFGTDEFLALTAATGAKPYINVNLGTAPLAEALRWFEYCNGDANTPQGRRRAANGHAAPYAVPYWGIGNETWGPWEAGHTTAPRYAEKLATWAAAFRKQDPSIKILAVGSRAAADPAWDNAVIRRAGHLIDYLTLHSYGISDPAADGDYAALAYAPAIFDARIRRFTQTIDAAAAERGIDGAKIKIALDEWNVRRTRRGKLDRRAPRSLQDALFVAATLNVFIRHSPRVAMANYVFLVNGHAPLLVNADAVVRTPLFHVFRQYTRWLRGTALAVETTAPSAPLPPRYGVADGMGNQWKAKPPVPPQQWLDAVAAEENGALSIALVNRHPTEPAAVRLDLPANYRLAETWTLAHPDHNATNTFAAPEKVTPVLTKVPVPASSSKTTVPAHSVVLLRFQHR